MYLKGKSIHSLRKKRVLRIRKSLRGTSERPRLSILKSLRHIGLQIIDDEKGETLAQCSTLSKEFKGAKRSKQTARNVGARLAEIAKEKGIEKVVFDRGRFKYHGIVAEVANAVREKGINF